VEHADVVEAEETAGEQVLALGVLAVDPPREIQQQLLECAREEDPVALAVRRGDLVRAPASPRVHWRIHVAKGKLVGWYLAVGMHVPFAEEERELIFGKLRIDLRKRQHMKRQIP